MTTAFGIAPDSDGNGVDPLTHRKVLQAHWVNTGVITGLAVSGRSDLKYNVGAGVAVCSRGSADGYTEAYWQGGQTVAVSAGDPSNPRIDRVWIKAGDLTQGDSNNQVTVGVTQGTPAASPVAPSAPAGCVRLMDMRVPAGATSTQSAVKNGSVDYAIPYGASLGLLAQNVNTADASGDWNVRKWYVENKVSFYVPTDRLVELVYSCTFSNEPADKWISWAVAAFQLDGKDIAHSGTEWQASNGVWEDHEVHCVVSVSAGTHTAAVRNGLASHASADARPYFRYKDNNGIGYKGRILRVWDRGVAR